MNTSKQTPSRNSPGSGRRQRSGGAESAAISSMFPFGSPINSSRRSILSPGSLTAANASSSGGGSHHILRGKVRAQDVYGGPLMFGGNTASKGPSGKKSSLNSGRGFNSNYTLPGPGPGQANGSVPSARRSRLLFSASPYHSAASARIMNHQQRKDTSKPSSTVATASNTPSPSSCSSSGSSALGPSADGMSSTARLILDTLDRMSTPLRDAQKMIPLPLTSSGESPHKSALETPSRAEKRKLIAEKLNLSSESPLGSAAKRARRRPKLGGGLTNIMETSMLKGPPIRSTAFMSPVPAARAKTKRPIAHSKPISPPQTQSEPIKKNEVNVPEKTPTSSCPPTFGLFSASAGQQSFFGGGKVKAKVSGVVRAPRPPPKEPLVSAPPAPLLAEALSLPVGTLPSISFENVTRSVQRPAMQHGSSTSSKTKEFKFSLPEKVKVDNKALSMCTEPLNGLMFKFSEPVKMNSTAVKSAPSSPKRMGVLPDFLTHAGAGSSSGVTTNKMSVMKMPSATPKPLLTTGSVMDVLGTKGNRGKLPDVTSTGKSSSMFEGGIKPATELKNASVMSILGGISSARKEPTWDSKFKTSSQPWQ